MTEHAGTLSERSALEVVRALHVQRATGVLEIDAGGHRRRLHLVDGELHLPGAHPLARRLADEVEALRSGLSRGGNASRASAGEGRRRLLQLVERIARVIAEWHEGDYRFVSGASEIESGLVGPLPTRRLLMVGATLELDEGELLARLGGSEARLATGHEAHGDADLLGLSPEESLLLERLRTPLLVAQVAASSPGDSIEVLRRLVQLASVGLVVRAETRSDGATATSRRAEDQTMLERLEQRIRRSLEERPIQLAEAEHRARVADLLARFGGLDHYELLDLAPDSPEARIQGAYEEIARLVHPGHAARLGLAGRETALDLLFERATTAFRTLSDPEARRRYNANQGIDVAPAPGGPAREAERQSIARETYERALAYSLRGDFHAAIQLLEQAVTLDRRAEYLRALARNLARNPAWRQRALESLRGALELDPNDAEVRHEMGLIYEEIGDLERARASYSAALRSNPSHAGAVARTEVLELREREERRGRRGKLGSLIDRWFGHG